MRGVGLLLAIGGMVSACTHEAAGNSLLLILVGFLTFMTGNAVKRRVPLFCTACGSLGPPRLTTKGSVLIEIVLWLCFVIPGLIYSLWRVSSRHLTCGRCGSASVVPADSPAATARLAGA